jgi:methanethiol oxidase
MALWKPDPTFYPSPKLAMQAPPEQLAYVAAIQANCSDRPDAMTVVDVDPRSPTYSRVISSV